MFVSFIFCTSESENGFMDCCSVLTIAAAAVPCLLDDYGCQEAHTVGTADFTVTDMLAIMASFVLVSLEAHMGQGQLRHILDLSTSLCGPRLLLTFFMGLLAAAEMLRLLFFCGAMLPPRRHVMSCLVYPLITCCIIESRPLALRAPTAAHVYRWPRSPACHSSMRMCSCLPHRPPLPPT